MKRGEDIQTRIKEYKRLEQSNNKNSGTTIQHFEKFLENCQIIKE